MGKLPMYQQIANDLRAAILNQELPPQSKLPTEAEISKQYEVSRITSKRALTELEGEKLIYRIQGKGSFVADPIQQNKSRSDEAKPLLFVLPFPDNPGVGNYAQGIWDVLKNRNYQLQMQPESILDDLPAAAIMNQFSGLLYYPPASQKHLDTIYQLYLAKFPVVLIDKTMEGIDLPLVASDNFQGGYSGTKHLLELGHTHISYLASPQGKKLSSSRDRYLGYLKALHDHKAAPNPAIPLANTPDENEELFFEELLTSFNAHGVTAVVVENDILAINFMNFLRKKGRSIPEDFSIVGFDNIQAASLVHPTLSTLSQDFQKIGTLAMELLLTLIEFPNQEETKKIQVPVELICRESTTRRETDASIN